MRIADKNIDEYLILIKLRKNIWITYNIKYDKNQIKTIIKQRYYYE